jgi:hypothetical protein
MEELANDVVTLLVLLAMVVLLISAMVAFVRGGRPPTMVEVEPAAPICDADLPEPEIEIVTPEIARDHMLTRRERAAKVVRDCIEEFCEAGNDENVIVFSEVDNAMIAELLEYKEAGWHVVFGPDNVASISLPAVLS